MSVFGFKEPSSKELGCSPQTPTLIGCIFLRIEAENFFFTSDSLRSVKSCILAQFLASLQSNFFDLFNTSDLHRFSSAEPCIVARFFMLSTRLF
ncbi:hypothetical protein, partial [Delftia acidovorans]